VKKGESLHTVYLLMMRACGQKDECLALSGTARAMTSPIWQNVTPPDGGTSILEQALPSGVPMRMEPPALPVSATFFADKATRVALDGSQPVRPWSLPSQRAASFSRSRGLSQAVASERLSKGTVNLSTDFDI